MEAVVRPGHQRQFLAAGLSGSSVTSDEIMAFEIMAFEIMAFEIMAFEPLVYRNWRARLR
jgi:hypothetical protein